MLSPHYNFQITIKLLFFGRVFSCIVLWCFFRLYSSSFGFGFLLVRGVSLNLPNTRLFNFSSSSAVVFSESCASTLRKNKPVVSRMKRVPRLIRTQHRWKLFPRELLVTVVEVVRWSGRFRIYRRCRWCILVRTDIHSFAL